jgi:acetyl esterase/lipase
MGMTSAGASGTHTWAIDYRMPPDDPYPAPLDDCLTAYRALLREHRPEDIIVRGGSAGGNLAAALVLRARDEGLPLPAAAVLMTPEVDLTESGDSFHTNLGVDSVLTQSLMPANLLYAGGHDLAHPYLSPLFGDFAKGFPPTFLATGTRDLFLSNTVRMHRALRAAGIPAELHVLESAPHGGFFGAAPEDAALVREDRRFCDTHWTG